MPLATPQLSELDLASSAEGSLDPLGLYTIADSLGVRLIPGVRERQSHPRYLTAIAAGTVICSEFDIDEVASDGVSEPWQVFEWYMVEGLVRTLGESGKLTGLPGIDKTRKTLQNGLHLSAARYLKTPTVFGFHGVYRVLAKELDVISNGTLGETGYRLITAWEKEQGLRGFATSVDGPGNDYRHQLLSAVKDGMIKAAVNRGGRWNGWDFFSKYLSREKFGKQESSVLLQALLSDSCKYRKHIIQFLTAKEGAAIWRATSSERDFHTALLPHADHSLKALLKAILSYEIFARVLQDAFDDCLYILSQHRGKTSLSTLAESAAVQRAAKQTPKLYKDAVSKLEPFQEAHRFAENFEGFSEQQDITSWLNTLIDHHLKIQKIKPPGGKLPWFDQYEDGGLIIRELYRRDHGAKGDHSYVQRYRTNSLWMFMQDMGELYNG